MSDPNETPLNPPADGPRPRSGRYRYEAGKPVDPDAGVHPEMAENQPPAGAAGIPGSPDELIAMQNSRTSRPEKPDFELSVKVKQVLELIDSLETDAHEDQQIALALISQLEKMHVEVVEDLQDDETAKHGQIVSWAIDADRLLRCRMLLESIDLD
jgi:hypothetical protein